MGEVTSPKLGGGRAAASRSGHKGSSPAGSGAEAASAMGQARREARAPVPEDQALPGRAGFGQRGTIPVLQSPARAPHPRQPPREDAQTASVSPVPARPCSSTCGEWEWQGCRPQGSKTRQGRGAGVGATVTAQRDSQVPRRATGAWPGRCPGWGAEGRGSDRGQRGSHYKGATGREHPSGVWGDQ